MTLENPPEPDYHEAFYFDGLPNGGPTADEDTGLRCYCGREVVNTIGEDFLIHPTGWAHVGEE